MISAETKPRLIIFDLDGTLAESKSPLDPEMGGLLCGLLAKMKVAVISGGSFAQFQFQFLGHLTCEHAHMANLFILPTVGASFYRYEMAGPGQWQLVYEKKFSSEEKRLVQTSIEKSLAIAAEHGVMMPEKTYGERIEDRESSMTFSAIGQQAPLSEKSLWDPDHRKREEIKKVLDPLLPDFEIQIGGTTSLDITKKGIDKEYGINALAEQLHIEKNDILYVGDSIFPGGNDYGAVQAGVKTFAVKDVAETKQFIKKYLEQLTEQ